MDIEKLKIVRKKAYEIADAISDLIEEDKDRIDPFEISFGADDLEEDSHKN